MRKSTFVRPLYFCVNLLCVVALGIVCLPAFAQDAVPASATAKDAPPVALPSDPKALLLLAAKSNNLTGDDVKPWHLKASYTSFDQNGKETDHGTFEEFWVSSTKYKRTFTGTAFKQTDYGTEKGILRSSWGTSKAQVENLRRVLFNSLPSTQSIEKSSFVLKRGNKYACLRLMDADGDPFGPTWCLDTDKPILRSTASSQEASIHDNVVSFQGRFIAGDLQYFQQGKLTLTAHLDSVELLATIDEALFLPPSDATPPNPKTLIISATIAEGLLIKKVAPVYPLFAKKTGVSGTVVLYATIGKDGRIANLHVVSGPDQLQQAATDAVKQWVYRPYLLNTEPVEVVTTINIVFQLGNR